MLYKQAQLRREVFHLFAQGLTNKQIQRKCPQTKDIKYFKKLLKPSCQLVFSQIHKVLGHPPEIQSDQFTSAKECFLDIMVSSSKFVYDGMNRNFFGKGVTEQFIKICKHFEKEGNLKNFERKRLSQTIKGIHDQSIKSSAKKGSNSSLAREVQHDEISINQQPHNQPYLGRKKLDRSKLMDKSAISKNRTPRPDIFDDRHIDLQIKEKQIEILRLQHQVFLQKQRILRMEREKLLIDRQIKPQKFEKFEQLVQNARPPEKPVNRQRVPVWIKQEANYRKKEVQHKQTIPQVSKVKAKQKPLQYIVSEQQQQQSQQQMVEEDSEFRVSQQEQQPQNGLKSNQLQKKQVKQNQVVKSNVKIKNNRNSSNNNFQQQSQTKIAKKSSKKPSQTSYSPTNHKQKKARSFNQFDYQNKKHAPSANFEVQCKLLQPQNRQYSYQQNDKNANPHIIQDNDHKWNPEEEKYYIELLADATLAYMQMPEFMFARFGNRTRFTLPFLLRKRYQMFKICSRKFVTNLKMRKILPQHQLHKVSIDLQRIDWSKAILFVRNFLKDFFYAQFNNIPKQTFIQTVKDILKQQKKKHTTKSSKHKIDQNLLENEQSAVHQLKNEPNEIFQENNNEDLQKKSTKISQKERKLTHSKNTQLQNIPVAKHKNEPPRKNMAIRTEVNIKQQQQQIQSQENQLQTKKNSQFLQNYRKKKSLNKKQAKVFSVQQNSQEANKNIEPNMNPTPAQKFIDQNNHKNQNVKPLEQQPECVVKQQK